MKAEIQVAVLCFLLSAFRFAAPAAEVAHGELFTLRNVTWDDPAGGTNYSVAVHTNLAAAPVYTFQTTNRITPVSNLVGQVQCWLAVRTQKNGQWSAANTNFFWPQPRENYQTWWQEGRTTPTATAIVVPGTLLKYTNPPIVPQNFRTLRVAVSNNVSPYQFPQ